MEKPFDDDVAAALGISKEPAQKRKADSEPASSLKRTRSRKESSKREDPVAPPNTPEEPETDERAGLYAQLCTFIDTFPADAAACNITKADSNADTETLKLQIAKINQRISARQELGIMHMMLISGSAGLEHAAEMIPGKPVKLQGLATNVAGSIHMFDEALKQVQCKYAGALSFGPEATVLFTLLRVCTTTHMANRVKEAALHTLVPPVATLRPTEGSSRLGEVDSSAVSNAAGAE